MVLLLRGTLPEYEQATGRYVFTLEADKATDLFSCLYSTLEYAKALPTQKAALAHQSSRIGPEFKIDQHEDYTFYLLGRYDVDPLDHGCSTLTIDLQTAAQLYAGIMFLYR